MTDGETFEIEKVKLYLQDACIGLKNQPSASYDLAIVDPPYGASTNATWKIQDGHELPRFGGAWKLADHAWDNISILQGLELTMMWLTELKRLVKPSGSIWIHSTYHNSGIVNVTCQLLGLEIINEVTWYKRNAFPNLSARRLTASHETLLWVHTGGNKRKYRFNYEDVKAARFDEDSLKQPGKQLRTVWDVPNNKARQELKFGSHPTQKPLRIAQRLLLISGLPGGRLLVPFVGSGTEMVAGLQYGMECVGFENDPEYFSLARRRISYELERIHTNPQLELVSAKAG